MNFVVLVLTVCTLAEPSACEEQRLTFTSDSGSLRGCMVQAQPFIAQWAGDHPGMQVARWRCVAPGAGREKI